MDKTPEPKMRVGLLTIIILISITGTIDLISWLAIGSMFFGPIALVFEILGWLLSWTWLTIIGVSLFNFDFGSKKSIVDSLFEKIMELLLMLVPGSLTVKTARRIRASRIEDRAKRESWVKKQKGGLIKPTRPPQPQYV